MFGVDGVGAGFGEDLEAEEVMKSCLRESRALGHDFIDTERILLALLRARAGVAFRVLTDLAAELSTARQKVQELLGPAEQ